MLNKNTIISMFYANPSRFELFKKKNTDECFRVIYLNNSEFEGNKLYGMNAILLSLKTREVFTLNINTLFEDYIFVSF